VTYGRPYLVGECGLELFVPGVTGRIETNDTLQVDADGAAAVSGSTNWTINDADNPREVVQQIDSRFAQLLRQMEAEQC
jgi:hypothetical protein